MRVPPQFRSSVMAMLSIAMFACGTPCYAQVKVSGLVRATPTTGLADSSLFLCNDSTKVATRACKFSDIQKRLAFKAFDSVITTGTFRPSADNAVTLGNSSFRFTSLQLSSFLTVGSSSTVNWASRTQLSSAADGQLLAQNNAATGPAYLMGGFGLVTVDTTITTTAAYVINFTKKALQGITISSTSPTLTFSAPTAPPGASSTQLAQACVRVKNTAGGAITNAVVWNAVFHFGSGGTPSNPASAQQYIICFLTDGTTYWELSRTTALAN